MRPCFSQQRRIRHCYQSTDQAKKCGENDCTSYMRNLPFEEIRQNRQEFAALPKLQKATLLLYSTTGQNSFHSLWRREKIASTEAATLAQIQR
jgi:hypothetical protein